VAATELLQQEISLKNIVGTFDALNVEVKNVILKRFDEFFKALQKLNERFGS
jgi:hypothetical protein